MTDSPKKYVCVFCHFRSDEPEFGCPQCGRQFGYGKAGVLRTIAFAQAILFTLIGGFLIFIGLKVLITELRLPYEMAPWWIFVIIFAAGAVFTTGGIYAFLGNHWLLRMLLFVFARNIGLSTTERR
jgi:uncharacterized membrane protein YphA (DoxX/SURF4 family)